MQIVKHQSLEQSLDKALTTAWTVCVPVIKKSRSADPYVTELQDGAFLLIRGIK